MIAYTMNQRFENLESKLAHLELTLDELNQVVYEQAKQLDLTRVQITHLQDRFKAMAEDIQTQPSSPEDERPPHY